MEQKTFLAIVISFIFLLSYNALVIEPQQKSRTAKVTQILENKSITSEKSVPSSTPSSSVTPFVSAAVEAKGTAESIENSLFHLDYLASSGHILHLTAKGYHYSPSLEGFIDVSPATKLESTKDTGDAFQFLYKEKDIEVTRTFQTIDKSRIKVTVTFKNISNLSSLTNVQFNLFNIDIHRVKDNREKMRENMLFEYSTFIDNKIVRKGNAFKFTDKENKTEAKPLEWAGWRDRYHFAIVKPDFKMKGYSIKTIDDYKISIAVDAGEMKLEPGATQSFDFMIYVGPQDLALLKNLDGNIHKIMAFSGFGFLDFIEKAIYNVLLLMNKYIPNWGVCIILISLLIYGATYPLTLKSMMSMRRMQELQPKMAELREKYKTNPQKLNTEVVQLYRTHNINPLSGCLPILLQMPVFISLYQVLWRTHNFQEAHFLWIKDLSEPDRLFIMPLNLPFLGNEFNLLPFLMMIVMFFQQKLSSKNMVIVDPSQEMQQKMMMYIMPVFIAAIFYHFASGLTLYFTVFYLLSTLTQWKMSKINQVK
jgi:YidC/Oxa1 family membrane protein insertase